MKKFFLLPILLCMVILVNAQSSPPWLWASGYGNGYGTSVTGIIANADGTEYESGFYYDDGDDIASEFVAKVDSNGIILWSKSVTVPTMFPGCRLAVDGNYNVYISGGFQDSYIVVGQDSIKAKNAYNNFYIAKFDSSGNFQWANCPGTVSSVNYNNFVGGMSGDASGNLWIAGGFGDSITFGSTLLTTNGLQSIFLVKYNSAGNVLLGEKFGGADADIASALVTDPSGNAYFTGSYQSPSLTFGNNTLTNAGTHNIFTVKCSPSGTVLWAKSAGGSANDQPGAMTIDNKQNIYISGSLSSPTSSFGNITIPDTSGKYENFIAKYDVSGNVLWAKAIAAGVLSTDKNGNLYAAGSFSSTKIIIGNDTLVNADPTQASSDIYLAKYDTSGNDIWALRLGGTLSDNPNAISNNANDQTYMAGSWSSARLVFTDTTLVNQQEYLGEYAYGFLAKLAANPCSYSLSYDTLMASDTGGTYNLLINTQTACGWSGQVTVGQNWLRLSRSSGNGSDSTTITVSANSTDTTQVGTIVINGITLTVIQPGNPATCHYSLSTNTFSCPSAAANTYYYISDVTTQAGCSWAAVVITGSDWLSSTSAGTGNGNISITVQANTTASSRIGTIYVNGQILTIAQPDDLSTCTYVLSGNSFNCTSAAATQYNNIATVTAADTCSWTATVTSGNNWLSTSSTGYGFGYVSISVQQNLTDSSRTGTIAVDGQTINIYQPDGASNCVYTLTQSAFVCPTPASGSYDSICNVETTNGCNWTATVTAGNDWLSTTSANSGNGNISVSVTQNTTGATRIGTIGVNGHSLSVVQLATTEGIANISAPVITVYPNPGAGQFYFKGITPGNTLQVYDVLGQNIFSAEMSGDRYLLNISSQAKGVYFYRVVNSNATVKQGKIILE